MDCACGPLNTKGFSESLLYGQIPQIDQITYAGCFNQIYFKVGKKAQQLKEFYIGYGQSSYPQNAKDFSNQSETDYFLGLFLKSSKDGSPRSDMPIQMAIVLDISGSMGAGLSNSRESTSRLSLSKQAIKLLFEKLRPTDLFSLVTFNNQGKTIIPMNYVQNLNKIEVFQKVDQIHIEGCTTILSGFEEGVKNINSIVTQFKSEKRIIMLTDVDDNSLENTQQFIQNLQESGINTTIIGISSSFISSTCEKLTNVKGFNYFCAVEDSDLIKYVVDNFDYTFFPSSYDIEIKMLCEGVENFEIFGTPDSEEIQTLQNEDDKKQGKFILTRAKSTFPSALELDEDQNVQQEGGLFLIKLKLTPGVQQLKGKFSLKCKSIDLEDFEINQEFDYPLLADFYSCKAMADGISSYYYVKEVKYLLSQLGEKREISKEQIINRLNLLKKVALSQNQSEIDNLIALFQNEPVMNNKFGY